MNIWVVGHKGRLGSVLIQKGCSPLECDITDKENIWLAMCNKVMPDDIVINCAAFTAVDKCETEDGMKRACLVNTRGVENLRSVMSQRNWRLIHISTDYVFDGKSGPYAEKNRGFDPVNAYGCTKYGGEVVLSTMHNPGDCVVRTTGLYGSPGKSDFATYLIGELQQRHEVLITDELRGNHTFVPHLADALMGLAKLSAENTPPILHLASKEVNSRYDFSIMLATVFGLNKNLITAVRNRDIPGWVAKRPSKGGLKTDLAEKLGLPVYSILDGVKEFRKYYD